MYPCPPSLRWYIQTLTSSRRGVVWRVNWGFANIFIRLMLTKYLWLMPVSIKVTHKQSRHSEMRPSINLITFSDMYSKRMIFNSYRQLNKN
jgi:hypothetical protein